MAHPQTVLTIEPEVICGAFFETGTDALINLAICNPSDTVYAQCKISRTTGGKQIDIDDFEPEHQEELSVDIEAIYKDGVVTIEGLEDDDCVLTINDIEV